MMRVILLLLGLFLGQYSLFIKSEEWCAERYSFGELVSVWFGGGTICIYMYTGSVLKIYLVSIGFGLNRR